MIAALPAARPTLPPGRLPHLATLIAASILISCSSPVVNETTSPPPPETTFAGTEIQLIAPVGASELLREFAWRSPVAAERYRAIVRRGNILVWQTEVTTERAAPPVAGTIERDVQYEWQVEALDREGNVRMTSPSQSFVVY